MLMSISLTIFLFAILALSVWLISSLFQRNSEQSAAKKLEQDSRCKAHDACAFTAEGIVNLAHAWEKRNWKLGCLDAIIEARSEGRDFKTKGEIEAEARRKQRRHEQAIAQRSRFARFLDVVQKQKSAGGILRAFKADNRKGGKHAGGWRGRSFAMTKARLKREREFMAPYLAKMRAGIPYKFSTVFDPRRKPLEIKLITTAQGARA